MIRTTAPILIALLIVTPLKPAHCEIASHLLDVKFRRVLLRASYRSTKEKTHYFSVRRVYMGVWNEKEVKMPAYHWRKAWGELIVGREFVMGFSNNPLVDVAYPIKGGLIQVTLGRGWPGDTLGWFPFSEIEALLLQRIQRHAALQLSCKTLGPLKLPEKKYQTYFSLQNLGTRTLRICNTPRHFGFVVSIKTKEGYRSVRSYRAPGELELSLQSFVELKRGRVIPVKIPQALMDGLSPGEYHLRVSYGNGSRFYYAEGKKVQVEDVWVGNRQSQWVPFTVRGKKQLGTNDSAASPKDGKKLADEVGELSSVTIQDDEKGIVSGSVPLPPDDGNTETTANPEQQTKYQPQLDFPVMVPVPLPDAPARVEIPARSKTARPGPLRSVWMPAATGGFFLLGAAFLFYLGWKRRSRVAG